MRFSHLNTLITLGFILLEMDFYFNSICLCSAILILACKIEILIWADTGAAGNAPTKSKTHNHSGFQLIYVEVSRRPPVVALKLFKMRIAGLCSSRTCGLSFFVGIRAIRGHFSLLGLTQSQVSDKTSSYTNYWRNHV